MFDFRTGDGSTLFKAGYCPAHGDKLNLLGVIIAVAILGVIRNGMVHLEEVTGISYHWRVVAKGAILILAVAIDAATTMALRRRQRVRQ